MAFPPKPAGSESPRRDRPCGGRSALSQVQICWLECGGLPAGAVLGEVERMATRLDGRLEILDRTDCYAVARAHFSGELGRSFKAGLALAGACFGPRDTVTVENPIVLFVVSTDLKTIGQSEQK